MSISPPSWNLNDLYNGDADPAIDALWPAVDKDIAALKASFEAREEGSSIADLVAQYEQINQRLARVGSYAQLRHAAATDDPETSRFYSKINDLLAPRSEALAFFTHGLIAMDQEPEAGKYQTWVHHLRRHKPHQLPLVVEDILIAKSTTSRDALVRLFDETLAAQRFYLNETVKTEAELLHIISTSPHRPEREKAAKALAAGLEKLRHLFTFITNTLAKDWDIEVARRGFTSAAAPRHLDNDITDVSLENLVTAVTKACPNIAHRYYRLKAQGLSLTKLAYWDRNAPWPGNAPQHYTWDEARSVVLNAFKKFSPVFAEIAEKFFDEQWIDAQPRPGKDGGAFSHPATPDVHPYILMNFHGSARDVMTLAHELGHGVHQYLAREQGFLQSDTPLTLAETASIFGEMLVFDYLLEQTRDPATRRTLLIGKIEDALNTVVRQIAFHRFETAVHQRRKEGELSSEDIDALWLEVQTDSLGDAFALDATYRLYWMYIPHFIHTPFYVYAYAYADGLVNSLYARYRRKPEGFADALIQLLKNGGSIPSQQALAPFGLDPAAPAFWDEGLGMIAEMVDSLAI